MRYTTLKGTSRHAEGARVFELRPVWSRPSGLGLCLWRWSPVGPAVQFSSLGGSRWHSGRGPLAGDGGPGARVISCLVSLSAVENRARRYAPRQQGALRAQIHQPKMTITGGEVVCVCRYELQERAKQRERSEKDRNGFKTKLFAVLEHKGKWRKL